MLRGTGVVARGKGDDLPELFIGGGANPAIIVGVYIGGGASVLGVGDILRLLPEGTCNGWGEGALGMYGEVGGDAVNGDDGGEEVTGDDGINGFTGVG